MKDKYIDDLKEIKEIMNRSSRFISLSGLSGIIAGITALLGAYLAYQAVFINPDYLSFRVEMLPDEQLIELLGIAIGMIVITIVSGIYFTTRATKKQNKKVWDHQTKRLLVNLAIPLVAGGIFCLFMLFKGFVGIVLPLTLIFYGLALVNASKFTLSELRTLGLLEILLGLIATQNIGASLWIWAIGFGLLHIVYGIIVHLKYKS